MTECDEFANGALQNVTLKGFCQASGENMKNNVGIIQEPIHEEIKVSCRVIFTSFWRDKSNIQSRIYGLWPQTQLKTIPSQDTFKEAEFSKRFYYAMYS